MSASFSRLAAVVGALVIATSATPDTLCTLNGSAGPCTLAGPVTVSSGYTAPAGTTTTASGFITNDSNAQFTAGSGSTTILNFESNTTLQGTGGTLTLNSGDNNGQVFLQSSTASTLTNATNTIQGYGVIGNSGLSVVNGAGGTLLANVSGQTLLINGTGGLTNNGILQANSGATLQVTSSLSNIGQSGGVVLAGGNFTMNNGTIQLSALGTGGGEILGNESTIVLNGANAKLTDAGGSNAISGMVDNVSTGNLSVLGGNQLSISPSDGVTVFNNYGHVDIGAGSSITLLAGQWDQDEGGYTQVDGQLTAGVLMDVGTFLTGTGQVNGSVDNGDSTVTPGDNGAPGTLTINGYYSQDDVYDAALDIVIGSAASSVLDVEGSVFLGDELNVASYSGFSPASGQSFDVLNYTGSLSGAFSSLNVSGLNLAPGLTASLDYSHAGEILLDIGGQAAGTVPEPGTLAMLIGGCGGILLFAGRRSHRKASLLLPSRNPTS